MKLKNIVSLASTPNAILPFHRKYPALNKINKKIEILIVPKPRNLQRNQKNVAIVWDEHTILKILQSSYANIIITNIKIENDLKRLAQRKPDLVFSGVKYFDFNDRTIWLNDYLEIHGIAYMASGRQAVDEYFKNQKIWLRNIDYSCRLLIK